MYWKEVQLTRNFPNLWTGQLGIFSPNEPDSKIVANRHKRLWPWMMRLNYRENKSGSFRRNTCFHAPASPRNNRSILALAAYLRKLHSLKELPPIIRIIPHRVQWNYRLTIARGRRLRRSVAAGFSLRSSS
jgi:hypothetical protein